MSPDTVIDLGQGALTVMVLIVSPLLLTALGVGLVIGALQAATQINEMTLSFIPKVVALVVVLIWSGPWILGVLIDYTRRLVESIPVLVG